MKFSGFIVLAIFMFMMLALPAQAQDNTQADSLFALLDKAEGEARLKILSALADDGSLSFEDRIEYAEELIELADELNKIVELVEANIQLGLIQFNADNNNQALQNLERAFQLSNDAGLEDRKAKVLNWMGWINMYNGYPETAVEQFNQAREIASEIRDKQIEARSLYSIAEVNRRNSNFEAAIEYYHLAQIRAEESEYLDLLPDIIGNEGLVRYHTGDYQGAAEHYEEAAELYLQTGAKFNAARTYLRLGNTYLNRADYDVALKYLQQALPIFEEENSVAGIINVTNSMGVIYFTQELYDKALEVQFNLLEKSRELGAKDGIAKSLNNIGNVYNHLATDSLKNMFGADFQELIKIEPTDKYLNLYDEALKYYNEAFEFFEEIGDLVGSVQTLGNIGIIYVNSGKPAMALEPLEKAMELNEILRDKSIEANNLLWLGQVYLAFENYTMALDYLEKALVLALEIDIKEHTRYIYNYLSQVYEKQNDFEKALYYSKLHFYTYDTLNQEDRRKAITDMQVKYETEATEKENALLLAESKLADIKLKQTRLILIITIIAIGVFIIMMVQLIRQNNLKRKANKELAQKNELITEQKKEITDSIQYASRIQNAMLPPGDYVDSLMPERFIIYMPRDIVSGDYYYITEKDERVICVTADCTGHGVPGAFMSMLGIAYLNEIISKHAELHTDMILGELRNHVIKSLHQTGKEGESQDGMDLALYILDRKTRKLEYSGANNSLLIYRNGELIEYKADKMPIGIHNRYKEPFKKYQIDLKKGDMIYTFSDGYPDQFGGPSQKKFMIKNFKRMLMEIHLKSMAEQRKIMEDTLQKWMADTEQIDDILVVGVRV